MKNLRFDIQTELKLVGLVSYTPHVLVVRASLPVNTLGDLIALAKQQPGKLTYASSGAGGAIHLASELFKREAGVDLVHVPYRGGGPAVLGLLSGDVDVFISDLSTTVENIRGGRLKALAMAWPKRSPFLPETPTFAELGLPAVVSSSWFGLAAPAGHAGRHRRSADPGDAAGLSITSFTRPASRSSATSSSRLLPSNPWPSSGPRWTNGPPSPNPPTSKSTDSRQGSAAPDVEVPEPSDSNFTMGLNGPPETRIRNSSKSLVRRNRMSGDVTEVLAGFAASLQYDDLPGHVRDHCKNVLLDTLACAVAGHRGEETEQLAALASGLAQSTESSVIGGDRLSLAGATILNGYLVTAVTMCDVHRSTLTHVTPEVIPPALAIAERDGLSGRDLLVAIAAGCEVTTRIGIGVDYPAFRAKGWHGPGVLGPFGAAAAVGRLRQFDTETMAKAFGLAGSQAAGTFAAWGTPTVKFHQCRGALSGLMAALLAEQKFLATREFLTAKDGGLFNVYTNGGRPEAVTADLGKRWELEQIALRLWPSASSIQGMNTAMFDLIEQHKIDPAKVKKVRVALSQPVFDLHGKLAKYKAKFDALISGHYTAAVILHDQELTLDQFEPARYDDPKLRRAAAEQIELRPDAALTGVQAVVEIETDGGTLTARCDHPRGSAENPLSRAQIESKFRTYADGVLTPSAIAGTIEAVGDLENLGSVRKLMDMLRARRGRPSARCWPRPAADEVRQPVTRRYQVLDADAMWLKNREERYEQTQSIGRADERSGAGGRHRCCGADGGRFSEPSHSHHRAASGRFRDRPAGAHARAEDGRTLGPAGHRGESSGRQRHHRNGRRRQGCARRLHAGLRSGERGDDERPSSTRICPTIRCATSPRSPRPSPIRWG